MPAEPLHRVTCASRSAQSQPRRTIYPGELLIEQGGISALHFFRRNRFKMTAEQPFVAERITHLAGALAVELILQGPNDHGTGAHGLLERRIHISDVQMNRKCSCAQRARTTEGVLW